MLFPFATLRTANFPVLLNKHRNPLPCASQLHPEFSNVHNEVIPSSNRVDGVVEKPESGATQGLLYQGDCWSSVPENTALDKAHFSLAYLNIHNKYGQSLLFLWVISIVPMHADRIFYKQSQDLIALEH